MKYLYTLFILLFTAFCFAQNTAVKEKRRNVYFFKNDGSPVTVQDSADFIRIISEPDPGSSLFDIKDFYANGKPKLIGQTLKVAPVTLQAQCVSYYPNGNRKFVSNYNLGQIQGPSYSFFPNGKIYITTQHFIKDSLDRTKARPDSLFISVSDSTGKLLADDGNGTYKKYNPDFKTVAEEGALKNGKPDGHWSGNDAERRVIFQEDYADGNLINGTATDSTGAQTTYLKRSIPAEFKGGKSELGRFIGTRLRYPAYSREHGIQGAVVLRFLITKEGKVSQIKIVSSVSGDVDQEALRVIRIMPDWQPGLLYGKPVATFYTIPLTFSLR